MISWIEMTHPNETPYCCGIACSSQGTKTKAGNYLIDLLLANVCKQNVTRFPYDRLVWHQDSGERPDGNPAVRG